MEMAMTLPKVDGNTEAVPSGVLGSPMVLQGCLQSPVPRGMEGWGRRCSGLCC